MGRGLNRTERVLSPDEERASKYLNDLILDWQKKDPIIRGRLRNTDLVRIIQQRTGKAISTSTIGKWLLGEKIPNEESTKLIVETFEADPHRTYEAFGHEYNPPLTWQEFYRQVEQAIEEWKQGLRPEEDWKMHSTILKKLALYFDEEWLSKTKYEGYRKIGWIPVAELILNNTNAPLIERAHQLMVMTEMEDSFRYVKDHPEEFHLEE